MYKALILDMDGTVLDSEKMVLDSLESTLAEYGVELTGEYRKKCIGCTSELFMAEVGLGDRAVEVSERWREVMAGMLHTVQLYEGINAVLAAPIRRGVVTSQTREELTANFGRLNLDPLFEFSVCADELPYQKPHPQPLLHCIENLGLLPEEALFVGDSQYDLGCALAAGVDFGLALWGAHDASSFGAANIIFHRPGEILEHMRQVR